LKLLSYWSHYHEAGILLDSLVAILKIIVRF
jgi:hypothetical protein